MFASLFTTAPEAGAAKAALLSGEGLPLFAVLVIGLYLLAFVVRLAAVLQKGAAGTLNANAAPDAVAPALSTDRSHPLRRTARAVLLGGFAAHGLLLMGRLAQAPGDAVTSGDFYFSLLAWVFILTLIALARRLKTDFPGLIVSPLALVLFTSSLALGGAETKLPPVLSELFFGLHIGTIFVSLGLLAVACGAGVAFMRLERTIKTKSKLPGGGDFASLKTLDRTNALAALAGFPLYTLGLVSGFIWARYAWDRTFSWDFKEIVSILIWLAYAFFFHQRLALGWKGRKPAWLAILLFCASMASLVGNLLLPTHHSLR